MKFLKSFSNLGFIKGGKSGKNELEKMTDTAWLLAYSLLWNDQMFSSKEKLEAKKYIQHWITGSIPNVRKAFVHVCQRIILVAKNKKSLGNKFPRVPSIWFDPENPVGFENSWYWLDAINDVRESLPNYKKEMKALAEAVLEFSEDPTPRNYLYWRDYFIERKKPGLLKMFTLFCANQKQKIN